jgi:hypothetical protein
MQWLNSCSESLYLWQKCLWYTSEQKRNQLESFWLFQKCKSFLLRKSLNTFFKLNDLWSLKYSQICTHTGLPGIRTHTIWDNSRHTLYIVQSKRIYEVHSLYIKHPIINAKLHFHQHVSNVCLHYLKMVSLLSQCILLVTHFLTTRCTEVNIHYHLVEEKLQHCHRTIRTEMFRLLQIITALYHCNLTKDCHLFWATKQHLGGKRFTTDGIKTEVREQVFTFISKTEDLITFYEESVVIYILPSNIRNLLNMTLHATHFSHLDHLQASK